MSTIFEGLNDIDAATARRRFRTHRMQPGAILTRAGEVGRGLAIVEEGALQVEVAGAVVGRIDVGGMLGEMGLFADGRRTATVRATEPTLLSLLTREGYEELRDTVHPICLSIEAVTLANQVGRLRATGRRVADLGLGVPTAVRPTNAFFAAVARLFGSGAISSTDGNVLSALLASRLFEGAPRPALEPIAERFESLACWSGAFLCTEGEEGDRMFLLESGEVEVLVSMDGTPQQVATLEAGAAFGMVSLASGQPRMASCVARSSSRLVQLDREGWEALIHEPYMVGSTFRRAVIRAFADQLEYSNAQLAEYENRIGDAESSAAEPSGLRNARRGLESHDRVVSPDP